MNDILICLWSANGFDRATQGVIGAGRRLADTTGGQLHAVLIGAEDNTLVEATSLRADHVLVADRPELHEAQPELYLAVLTGICRSLQPRAVLLGSDVYSQELTPRLAHRLEGSSMADGAELTVAEGGALRVRRTAYGGRANAVYELGRQPAVVWLRARGFAPAEPIQDHHGTVTHLDIELPETITARIAERYIEARDGVPLEDAALVVSGGRGLGGPEPFEELRQLAAAIGAEVGASRVACDEGWVPASWQVGQTGKKIAPELYLAIGISGAAQHLLGIADAKVIAVINSDPDAPIFKHAAFGLVEDYRKVLPALTAKLAELATR